MSYDRTEFDRIQVRSNAPRREGEWGGGGRGMGIADKVRTPVAPPTFSLNTSSSISFLRRMGQAARRCDVICNLTHQDWSTAVAPVGILPPYMYCITKR